MAQTIFKNVSISGIACAVPKHIDTVESNMKLFGSDDGAKKFIDTTGIRERHYVENNQTCSDLCFVAAENLISHKGYPKDSFDGIIFVSQTSDYLAPATAYVLHKRMGMSKDCMAFDVNLGCSGFVYGVFLAASMICAGALNRVLLCCGEAHNCFFPQDEKATSMLFGDAGSAVILERGDDVIHAVLKANGEGYRALSTPGVTSRVKVDLNHINYDQIKQSMDGSAVFEFSILEVPRLFGEFFKRYGGTLEDYDACVLHQANLFMLRHIAKKIKLPLEKMPISIDRYGNTSSASIPLTIADLCENEKTGDRLHLIASGFGIGLSWGVIDFHISKESVLPIVETDDYYKEAYLGNI